MNCIAKIEQLKNKIDDAFLPLLGKKVILLDAPFYHNIGDVLIWEGERQFLLKHGIECLYTASYETCTYPSIEKDVTILINGGGNMGDLYHEHVEFLQRVCCNYSHNRIIVCPQTVYYKDAAMQSSDLSSLAKHPNLFFLARDLRVLNLLKLYFGDRTQMVPDMAFYIPNDYLCQFCLPNEKEKLLMLRDDVESKIVGSNIGRGVDVSDWPVFEKSFRRSTFLNKLFKRTSDFSIPFVSAISNRIWNVYAVNCFRVAMIKEGVEFISPYHKVETERLHGCILSILLNRESILLRDNSYGKNRFFYETWLSDLDNVKLV